MVEFRKIIKKEEQALALAREHARAEDAESAFTSRAATGKLSSPDRSAQDLYLEGLALSAAVFEWAATGYPNDFPLQQPLASLTRDVCNWLDSDQAWKLLCLCRASSEPLYLPAHSMNACLMSAYLARYMGLTPDQTLALAVAAFLHDIGMARVEPVWDCGQKLAPDKFAPILRHPLESLKLIDCIGCCEDPGVALAAVEHHERIDGSGYPNHKRGGEVATASHILSVVDVFLAMTHKRLYREAVKPFEAVRVISQLAGRQLQTEAVRTFLQAMSIYPIGSGVRLNNGLVGRVIAANEKQLTKPVVQIVGAAGEFCETNQVIDLQKEKLLFVREAVCLGPLDPVFNIG